tara:strand:- start:254 stop:445 length:192 start_codon:yes stop_codon:yes gene_type:complete
VNLFQHKAWSQELLIVSLDMKQSTIINRIHGLEITAALNRELGNVTRAEMNQSAIDRLTLLLK